MMGRVCFSTETPRNRSWRKEARLHSLRSLHVPLRPLLAEPGRTPEPEGPPGQRSEPNLQEQHGEGRRGKRRSPAPRRRASIHSKDITVSILPVDFRAGDLFHIVTQWTCAEIHVFLRTGFAKPVLTQPTYKTHTDTHTRFYFILVCSVLYFSMLVATH